MGRATIILLFLSLMSSNSFAQVWATAVSRNEKEGTAIVYRYVEQLPKDFTQSAQPDRVIIVWRYYGEKGMPSVVERMRMDELENALQPAVESRGFATLALVSTGANLKEWIYYAKSEHEFITRLNAALTTQKPFPIEIHGSPDPGWSAYKTFISTVIK